MRAERCAVLSYLLRNLDKTFATADQLVDSLTVRIRLFPQHTANISPAVCLHPPAGARCY
jgi:hypothetical protein